MWCHLLLAAPLAVALLFVVLPWSTTLPAAAGVAVATALIVVPSMRALRRPVVTGRDALLGAVGLAVSDLSTEGLVRVRSELWLAEAPERISRGGQVQVVDVTGAKLRVRRREGQPGAGDPGDTTVPGSGPREAGMP